MATVHLILMVFAFVLFILAALGIGYNPTPPAQSRYNLMAAGLACWSLSLLLS